MSHEKEETIQIYQGWEEFYGIEAIFRDGCGNWFSLTEPATE